jgi:hypothetical protein
VYDVAAQQLRVVEVAGSGTVATFHFDPDGGPARAVTVGGMRFERVER